MAEASLSRRTRNTDAVVGTSAAASSPVPCGDVAGGIVVVSGMTASATFTVHGSVDGQTFAPLFDSSGAAAAVVVPAGDSAVPLPDAVYPVRGVKLVSGSNIGTAVTVVVMLKT